MIALIHLTDAELYALTDTDLKMLPFDVDSGSGSGVTWAVINFYDNLSDEGPEDGEPQPSLTFGTPGWSWRSFSNEASIAI